MGPAGNCLCASGEFTKASVFEGSVLHGLVTAQGNLGGETRRRELRLLARIRGDDAARRVRLRGPRVCRQRTHLEGPGASAVLRHRGDMPERVCAVLGPCVAATPTPVGRAAAKGPRSNVSSVLGIRFGGSQGWRCRLRSCIEQDGEWLRPLAVAGGRLGESPKSRKAQGSIGPVRRGNAECGQRTSGGATPEVEAPFGKRAGFGRCVGRKESQPREGLDTGVRASNGAVTVATSLGGKSSEGSVPAGMVGCRRQRRRWACNRANPMVGSGMQQAHMVVCGRNRRSREKRQGRNCGESWQLSRLVFGLGQQDANDLHRRRGGL